LSVIPRAVSIHGIGIRTQEVFLKFVPLDTLTGNNFVETMLQNYDTPSQNSVADDYDLLTYGAEPFLRNS
jgi:hypothetical protein